MDLFTYLLGKKGKNSLVHKGDLFAYLLGKRTPKEVKTASGTTISISDVTSTKIVSLTLSKESTQDGTPTPENPVEVKTVKGYRNLFDKSTEIKGYYINASGVMIQDNGFSYSQQIEIQQGIYRLSGICGTEGLQNYNKRIHGYDENGNWVEQIAVLTVEKNKYFSFNFTINNSTIKYIRLSLLETDEKIILTEGTEELPYVPYGTNYVAITNTNGTDTNYYTIPLNGNEIAGIGTYKDELIVDKNGKCWLNKKTGKVVLNGSEDWTQTGTQYEGLYSANITKTDMKRQNVFNGDIYSNYFVENSFATQSEGITKSLRPLEYDYIIIRINNTRANTLDTFKAWLSTHNTEVYYVLATENLIDLNYTVDVRLFNGVNNISNSEDMNMTLKYY